MRDFGVLLRPTIAGVNTRAKRPLGGQSLDRRARASRSKSSQQRAYGTAAVGPGSWDFITPRYRPASDSCLFLFLFLLTPVFLHV